MAWIRRPEPGVWKVGYRVGGTERSKTFRRSKGHTYKDVLEFKRSLERGPQKTQGSATVEEFSKAWLESLALKPKTVTNYQSLLNAQIIPRFGSRSLESLSPLEVQSWVTQMQVGPYQARNALRVLRQLLEVAVDNGYIQANPARGVKLPRMPRKAMKLLTLDELYRLASVMPRNYGGLVLVYGLCGLRFGEGIALQGKHVRGSRLLVEAQVSTVTGKQILTSTKTHQSRLVVLPRSLQEQLSGEPDELLFPAPRGGHLHYTHWTRRLLVPALKEAGLDHSLRTHDLRHTCAALLISQGVHPQVIRRHLGHSSIQVTLDTYGHLLPDEQDSLQETLNGLEPAARMRTAEPESQPIDPA